MGHQLDFALGSHRTDLQALVQLGAPIEEVGLRPAMAEAIVDAAFDVVSNRRAGARGGDAGQSSAALMARLSALLHDGNEARIKTLSGGDAVTARTMRGDFFTYRPSFKLFITGNHKPELTCVDEAIRRRFNLVPFAVTIADPDPALPRKLEAEWPGILAWMIEGALEWQRIGLAPPEAVTAATAAYLAEEDTFGGWLDECVEVAPESDATSADLFASWASYAQAAQEPAGSKKAFARALQARGFARCRIGHSGANGFKGIRLRVPLGKSRPTATLLGRRAQAMPLRRPSLPIERRIRPECRGRRKLGNRTASISSHPPRPRAMIGESRERTTPPM